MLIMANRCEFAPAICKALGIDETKVRRMDIHLDYSDIVTVEIEQFVDSSQDKDAATVVSCFDLHPKLKEGARLG
ncbi:MAG: hypothetical protein SVK08_00800 [Halobacteriota archaeon]|nr:hypothetical protein [Halobacteriota archaeon]